MHISENRLKKITEVVKNRQSGFIVVLEDIHDPHNAGAILRSCDAFGVKDVWLIFNKEKAYNPRKVGKSSSSTANKWLDYKIFSSAKACARELKRLKYYSVATALTPMAKPLYAQKLTVPRIALWVGNEHSGLSAEAIALADECVLIPMRGMVQSLNVSVTAAACIAEISRQRMASRKSFKLPPAEFKKLLKNYSAR